MSLKLKKVNVEKTVVDFLLKSGCNIKWIADYNCGMLDEDLLSLANKEKRILITNDKDFGELVFLQKRLSSGIILFRIKGKGTQEKIDLMKKILKNYRNKLLNNFIVVSKKSIRIIPIGGII